MHDIKQDRNTSVIRHVQSYSQNNYNYLFSPALFNPIQLILSACQIQTY